MGYKRYKVKMLGAMMSPILIRRLPDNLCNFLTFSRYHAKSAMTLILLLSASSLLSGFIDAVVGGGGLIQIPAMLILLPGASVATILGTHKFPSCPGTKMAVQRYARHVAIECATVPPAPVTAFALPFLAS